jgi:hypothetical protein
MPTKLPKRILAIVRSFWPTANVLPHALLLPAAEVTVDRLPRGKIMRAGALCRSRPQYVENGVDQLARRGLPWSPTNPRVRNQGTDHLPLPVGQIGTVAPPRWRLASLVRRPMHHTKADLGILFKRALSRATLWPRGSHQGRQEHRGYLAGWPAKLRSQIYTQHVFSVPRSYSDV